MKAIQEWLGHSDFSITANTYAHLDYKSKIASADKMAWIGNTSLASDMETSEPITLPTTDKVGKGDSIQALPDFMQSLFTSGVPMGVIQAWIAQADFTSNIVLADNFNEFQSKISV